MESLLGAMTGIGVMEIMAVCPRVFNFGAMQPIVPSFTHLPQFVTPQHYADLCGVKVESVYHRHSRGHLASVVISGKVFIDRVASPPTKKYGLGRAKRPRPTLPAGMPPVERLVCLDTWAFSNRVTANRLYSEIMFGRLPAWGFGDHVVVELTADLGKARKS